MSEPNDDRLDALLRHVVQTAPMPGPPAGFARQMARQVRDHGEDARLESWLTRAVIVVAALAAGGLALPAVAVAGARVQQLLGDAPWPLLLAAGAAFGAVRLFEIMHAGVSGRHARS